MAISLVIVKKTSQWLSLGSAKVRPKYVLGVTVETMDEILIPHIVVDVWMVVRGADADAFELFNPNTDLREAEVVLELHVIVVAHGLDKRQDLPVLHWVFAPGTNRRIVLERCARVGWVQRMFTVARVQFYG